MIRAAIVLLVVAITAAGCGGSSIESKVSKRTGESVSSCRAVGKTELGKLYSCQTEDSTVCVMVDGDDVFSGVSEAARVGISC